MAATAGAVLAGMNWLQLAQLFSAVAGGAFASAQIIGLIEKEIAAHAAAHPEDVARLKKNQPELHAQLQTVIAHYAQRQAQFQAPDTHFLSGSQE